MLRLVADDGELPAYDEMTVRVEGAVPLQIITPAGAGQAAGSGYFPLAGGFDSQPTWDAQNAVPVGGGTAGTWPPSYESRQGYIDFGADWRNIRIASTWTQYRVSSGGAQTPFASLWWDDDTDNVNDNGVAETTLNFNTAASVAEVNYLQWIRDVDCSLAPITPKAHYLIVASGPAPTGRATEFAFVGYVIANIAPAVSAGSDATVTLPGPTDLDGTVSDDGLPDPPAATTTAWSKVSGPGTVAFGNAAAVDTTATFSEPGTYVLRLTAGDGELTAYDETTVTVLATGLLGDFSGDGVVDIGDYTVWADHFGIDRAATFAPGSFPNPGLVDIGDYTTWADHFGQTTAPEEMTVAQGDEPAVDAAASPTDAPGATGLTPADQRSESPGLASVAPPAAGKAAAKRAQRLQAHEALRLKRAAARQARLQSR